MRTRLSSSAAGVLLSCFLASVAVGAPSASITYEEVPLAEGTFRYHYSIVNTSDPTTDAGVHLYDFLLQFSSVETATIVTLPLDWDSVSGAGFAETFSTAPSADVLPGQRTSGFEFDFNYRPGNIAFFALLTNPVDPGNPFVFEGITSQVPEPYAMNMLLVGLFVLLGRLFISRSDRSVLLNRPVPR